MEKWVGSNINHSSNITVLEKSRFNTPNTHETLLKFTKAIFQYLRGQFFQAKIFEIKECLLQQKKIYKVQQTERQNTYP